MIRFGLGAAALSVVACAAQAAWPEPRPINERRLKRAGIRAVKSERCTLVTDLPIDDEVDALPRVIDLATAHWAERFGVEPAGWRVRLYLIDDRDRFAAAGLMPRTRDFADGLALGYEAWVAEQPSPYYRRALVLHEATHSYMMTRLGGCGPGWHMEGVAELCGGHAWEAATETLALGVLPASREDTPYWGRVKLIRDGPPTPIAAVLKIDNRAALPTSEYAAAWALAYFLDNHPAYRERFRSLAKRVTLADFNARFRALYADDRARLQREWRLFASTLVYGHDVSREAIVFDDGLPTERSRSITGCEIRADRGWQSTGVRVEAGNRYRIAATGRFVIARDADGTPWPCEAGGVTLRYHGGRPLGELLAVVDDGPDAFTRPKPVGLAESFEASTTGTLYLRVNDSPAELSENEEALRVRIID